MRHITIEDIDKRDKRIEKAEELLKQPLLELKERLLSLGWLENSRRCFYKIGERISVHEEPSIGLSQLTIYMEYNARTFIAFRNYNGLEFLLRSSNIVRDIDQAREMVKYFECAEAALRREFNEIIEPLIPAGIWDITA